MDEYSGRARSIAEWLPVQVPVLDTVGMGASTTTGVGSNLLARRCDTDGRLLLDALLANSDDPDTEALLAVLSEETRPLRRAARDEREEDTTCSRGAVMGVADGTLLDVGIGGGNLSILMRRFLTWKMTFQSFNYNTSNL